MNRAAVRPRPRRSIRGLTLVELLVAITIGLVLTLAVTGIVVVSESHRRSMTAVNDANQSGAYAASVLDLAVRSAGSGFVQAADHGAFGCQLGAGTVLPHADPFPAPFKNSFLTGRTTSLRLAPVLIAKNQSDAGSDVLVVMSGNGAAGDVPRRITSAGDAHTLKLDASTGFSANDLVLVSRAATPDCLVEPISSVGPGTLTLGGAGYAASGPTTAMSSFASDLGTYVTHLGSSGAGNAPFQLFGVGDNDTLFAYDLLSSGTPAMSEPLANDVMGLHALYGLDSDGDGILDSWASPDATGNPAETAAPGYDIDTVMATPAKMKRIVAVRLALVLRDTQYEKDMVAPMALGYFADLRNSAGASLAGATTLATDPTVDVEARHYRYRVVETTIPLRNTLILTAP
ncbi:MAG: PilW family protein [Bordetella sp.]|nr:PilW family protein [Pseudomonadota bacterium]MDQ8019278.1 PilW family protein [Pseudomonadota bacterium]